ncbi:MAG: hypothetical protein GXO48_07075 [Chlorobi bacterium]|nr:hypothetical protein [Chlorobiota bacterium]
MLFLSVVLLFSVGSVFGQGSVLHFVQEPSRSVSESYSWIFNFGSRQLLVNMQRRRVSFTLLDSVGKPVKSGFIALPGDMRLTSGAKTDSGVIIALGAPTMSPSFIVRVDTTLNVVRSKKLESFGLVLWGTKHLGKQITNFIVVVRPLAVEFCA